MRHAAMLWGNVKVTTNRAFVYIAYASDASGTGFTMTFDPLLDYISILSTNVEISSPQASDFTGLWKRYKGEAGVNGDDETGGGGSEAPELHLDFEEAGDEFVYNVPYAMKFTSMACEGTDPTLSVPLNTNLARYDKLTITATAVGLVSLYGEYV